MSGVGGKELFGLESSPKKRNKLREEVAILYLDAPRFPDHDLPGLGGSGLPAPLAPGVAGYVGVLAAAFGGDWWQAADPDRGSRAAWPSLLVAGHGSRSQYDALRGVLAAEGPPPENLASVALTGIGFHGQHGRPWATLTGNLHLSAVMPCDLPVPDFAPVLPALPAVATVRAVRALGQGELQPGIKWVNDVLVNGSKVAGSLTAVRTRQGRIEAVVLGVGLNVLAAPRLAGGGQLPATCLAKELPQVKPTLTAVLEALLQAIDHSFREMVRCGPEVLLAAYRHESLIIGRQVIVQPESGASGGKRPTGAVRTGIVGAIGADLALHLVGQAAPVTDGRVEWPPMPAGT